MKENYSVNFDDFKDFDDYLGYLPDKLIHHKGIRMSIHQMITSLSQKKV